MASLCTARLVCRLFRQSASGHLKALHLDCAALPDPPTTNFSQFAGLTRLAVSVAGPLGGVQALRLLKPHRIGPFITHVSMAWQQTNPRAKDLAHLMFLPKLRSLQLQADMEGIRVLPLTLEELHLYVFHREDVSPLTRFSRLRELNIVVTESAPGLGSLTALRALRSMRLRWHGREASLSHRELLSTFTMLTSLALVLDGVASGEMTVFPGLARLTGLLDLEVTV